VTPDHVNPSSPPEWQRHHAARTVAQHAHDAQDLAMLLAMLGLTAAEGLEPPEEHTVPPPRKPVPHLDEECASRLNNMLRSGHS
jgi:hypothetical protein